MVGHCWERFPSVGADICGFIYDTTEELCARWAQVGAFYPFARYASQPRRLAMPLPAKLGLTVFVFLSRCCTQRNHNGYGYASQEFYRWDSVAAIARTSLRIRYTLLPYWYTLMEESNRNGAAVVRPLFYEFPSDPTTIDLDRQFLLG